MRSSLQELRKDLERLLTLDAWSPEGKAEAKRLEQKHKQPIPELLRLAGMR